jgi:hypothetical protein
LEADMARIGPALETNLGTILEENGRSTRDSGMRAGGLSSFAHKAMAQAHPALMSQGRNKHLMAVRAFVIYRLNAFAMFSALTFQGCWLFEPYSDIRVAQRSPLYWRLLARMKG